MPNIYITDETKEMLEKVATIDCRTQDGEISYLLQQRLKELNAIPANGKTSVSISQSINENSEGQEENVR